MNGRPAVNSVVGGDLRMPRDVHREVDGLVRRAIANANDVLAKLQPSPSSTSDRSVSISSSTSDTRVSTRSPAKPINGSAAGPKYFYKDTKVEAGGNVYVAREIKAADLLKSRSGKSCQMRQASSVGVKEPRRGNTRHDLFKTDNMATARGPSENSESSLSPDRRSKRVILPPQKISLKDHDEVNGITVCVDLKLKMPDGTSKLYPIRIEMPGMQPERVTIGQRVADFPVCHELRTSVEE